MHNEFTLAEVLTAHTQAALENVHTAIPGVVLSYDGHAARTATIQPAVRLPMTSGPILDIPPITGVPIVFPSTAAGSLLFPVSKGDTVLLVFSEVCTGNFLSGDGQDLANPDATHRHSLSSPIAIPGLYPAQNVPAAPSADSGSTVLVSAEGALIEVGSTLGLRNSTTDLRTLMGAIWDELKQIRTDLAAQFTSQAAAITASAAASAAPAFTAAATAQTASVAGDVAGKINLQGLLT